MGRKVIFHIDVNSAFLSWEAVYRIRHLGGSLDLRTIPSAVGGDITKRHGIILAKSIPAKKYKIQTGEPVVDALRNAHNWCRYRLIMNYMRKAPMHLWRFYANIRM